MQVFSIKRTHLLLFCLILISCQDEIKIISEITNLARNYQCEITNSVDYLIEMHQFDQTNFRIITSSNTSVLEVKTNDFFNLQGNFVHLLSKIEINMLLKVNEEIKFLENNEQNYEETNIQEIVFEINPQERLYFYIMSFSSSKQDVQVTFNQSDILISFNKNIQSDVNVQLIFAAPVQINIPILNRMCKEDNCKKKPLHAQYLIGLQQSSFLEQNIQSVQYSVNSYLFTYHRFSNLYLSRIISQNITQHLSLSECKFENRWENLVNQIELEVNQYKCLKNKIDSQVISLKMSKNYNFPSQLHLLMVFEIPLGINLDQIIFNLVQNFQQTNCNQIYEKPKHLLINAAFVQIQQLSMESESQFQKYNEEKQIQQEKTTADIIIQPFQNFVISDEETQEEEHQSIEDYIANNIDQRPIYKTLNGIYTPQVPDLYEYESDQNIVEADQNKEEIEQNKVTENNVEQEVVDQQSLIQKVEEPQKETSDFIIYEDPISWNENGQQEVEVFSLEENNQNVIPQNILPQNNINQPDTMIIEQAKVEEVNFDEIPSNQQIIQPLQPEIVVQTIPNQEQQQQNVQQEDQKQNEKAQDQKDPYNSDYSDYYEYSEDYDNYYRHLHHNHQLKHNFHHHKYDYTEQYKNNLRARKRHESDDTLPIVADRIIIEYNFANKLKEEKIKMHGDDQVEEEEKEDQENENTVQQTKKPKNKKLENDEEQPLQDEEEKQPKKKQKKEEEDQNESQENQQGEKKQQSQPKKQNEEKNQPKKSQSREEDEQNEPEQDQQAPLKQQTQPKKQKQPQKEEVEEEPENEEVPKKKTNALSPQKQKAKPPDIEEEEEVSEKPKKQKEKAPQKEEDEEIQDEEPKPKKKQAAKKQQDEEENEEIQDEGGNAEKEEEEEVSEKPKKQKEKAPKKEEDEEIQDEEPKPKKKQAAKKQEDEEGNDEIQDEGENAEKEEEKKKDKASQQKKKQKKQVQEEEEECENDEQEKAEEKEEQNNDEAQQDEAENEQDECNCEKKKKNKEKEEEEQEVEDEGEQEAQKDKKKKKGKKKQKDEEEEQYDYYGRYVRNHPYFESRNRYINRPKYPMDEDMYWRYRSMNRQVRNQGYPFNPYQHRRNQIDANVFHRMNPYRTTPNVGCIPNMIRQRNYNYGMPIYRGAQQNQEYALRELAYKHAQQQYAKQQVKQYRDKVGYFNCYGQDYYRPEYYESYQGAIQDDPRYQVINRNMNDPNVFSPFDESLYYRNAQPQNIYRNNMAQQNIKIQDQQPNNDTSCFQVFDQCNFQGKSINLCGENPMLPQDLNGFKIFSYIVPQNLEIKFSQPKENQGELSTLEGSQECLQSPYQLIPHNS